MSDTTMERDGEGLARTISVTGLQVSQAADELAHAAQQLMDAEMRVREAEARWAVAEDQIEQGATKNAELLEMLQTAREAQMEADERSRRAEQRLQIAIERSLLLEEQAHELELRLEEAEAAPEMTVVLDDERTALQEAVAAEVRRPLTSILGLTLALKHADPKTAEGADMVKQLATNARKLDRLVGEMLELDKIASGSFEPNLRRTDLEALVHRVIEESPDLRGRDVRVETAHVATEVDPGLAEQMIETLLANADRRTTPGNPVWVKLAAHGDGAVISVDDTGPEVPPGLRGALFAAASHASPAERQKTRGATGLSLLARLAALHGGRAWVEGRPGGGASFRVAIPAPCGDEEAAVENVRPIRTVEDRAVERARDVGDERAMALAKALVAADDDEDDGMEVLDPVSANGAGSTIADRIAFDDLTGEIRL
jgi:signal transduction histidine kinase